MQKEFDGYKTKLETEKGELIKEIMKAEKPEDFGDDVDDMDEEKNEAESFNNQQAFAQTLKTRVNEIDAALNKIASGTYGNCETCGKKIEEAILNISPESRFCKNCKKGK